LLKRDNASCSKVTRFDQQCELIFVEGTPGIDKEYDDRFDSCSIRAQLRRS